MINELYFYGKADVHSLQKIPLLVPCTIRIDQFFCTLTRLFSYNVTMLCALWKKDSHIMSKTLIPL